MWRASREFVPPPLAGEGRGGGWFRIRNLLLPPFLSLPRKGGGNAVALAFATEAHTCVDRSWSSCQRSRSRYSHARLGRANPHRVLFDARGKPTPMAKLQLTFA